MEKKNLKKQLKMYLPKLEKIIKMIVQEEKKLT